MMNGKRGSPALRTAVFTVLLILTLVLSAAAVSSAEASYEGSVVTSYTFDYPQYLSDGNENSYGISVGETHVSLYRDLGISSVYVVFDRIPGEYTVRTPDGSRSMTAGKNGFLHEFIDVAALTGGEADSVELVFPDGVSIDEIYVFGAGDVPSWVQRWQPMLDECDLLLLSSHSDDEQLFMGGILPIYAGERHLKVQVVYLTNHFDTHERPHEQLNGLWEVGVTAYPLIGPFPDIYSESYDGAIQVYEWAGYSYEDFQEFVVMILRRFKPLVAVTHDVNGEYGHGTHLLCCAAFRDALVMAPSPSKFQESYDEYGAWTVEKAYIHLYPENEVTINLDRPLEAFGGKTAFEMMQAGFSHHKSQHWTWFYEWIYGTADAPKTSSSQITSYSPSKYGLYLTGVGFDTLKNDFFENVVTYEERENQPDTGDTSAPPEDTETEPPETDPPETGPRETTPPDTEPPETEPPETGNGGSVTDPGKKSEGLSPVAVCILLAAVMAVIIVFTVIFKPFGAGKNKGSGRSGNNYNRGK